MCLDGNCLEAHCCTYVSASVFFRACEQGPNAIPLKIDENNDYYYTEIAFITIYSIFRETHDMVHHMPFCEEVSK